MAGVFQGRATTAGNSEALRFDKALFRQHPEFRGPVTGRVVGPGVMLVVADAPPAPEGEGDPMLAAWLSFIEGDARHLSDMPDGRLEALEQLVEGVEVSPDDDLDAAAF